MAINRIESLDNSKIKMVHALHQRHHREANNYFIAEGVRLVEEAISSSWKIKFVLVSDEAMKNERVINMLDNIKSQSLDVYLAKDAIYRKASATDTPQGVLCVMERRRYSISDIVATLDADIFISKNVPLIVVLDGIQDPGNVGTIIRTSLATNVNAIISLQGTADIFSDKVVRSSMGAIFRLPIVTDVTIPNFISFAEQQNINVFVSSLNKNAKVIFDCDFRKPTAFIFGNEGTGVSIPFLQIYSPVFIPMNEKVESLNVASSVSAILYETIRQRYYDN